MATPVIWEWCVDLFQQCLCCMKRDGYPKGSNLSDQSAGSENLFAGIVRRVLYYSDGPRLKAFSNPTSMLAIGYDAAADSQATFT